MTKQERLQEIYADLRSRGIVRNKKDLAALVIKYGVSADWLLTGRGWMFGM